MEEVDQHDQIPEKMLRFHLIEVKVPWGGRYPNETGGNINTLHEVRKNAFWKYKKAIEE
jgi:hypothetical protein